MTDSKKTITLVAIAAIVVVATAATITPKKNFRNLQVLPQNISDHQLDSIMDTYNRALKVDCDFCHKPVNNLTGLPAANDNVDFAADNPMKENARRMMRMTIGINKNNFNFDTIPKKPDYLLNVVTCNTCHRGNAFPAHE
jgi:uncharacterized membrane protein